MDESLSERGHGGHGGHGHSHGFDADMQGTRSLLLVIALSLHRIFEGEVIF